MTTSIEGENKKSLSAEDELLVLEKFERKTTMFHSPEAAFSRFRLSGLPTQQVPAEDSRKFDSLLGAFKRYLDTRGIKDIRVQGNRKELVIILINDPVRAQRIAFLKAQKQQASQSATTDQ